MGIDLFWETRSGVQIEPGVIDSKGYLWFYLKLHDLNFTPSFQYVYKNEKTYYPSSSAPALIDELKHMIRRSSSKDALDHFNKMIELIEKCKGRKDTCLKFVCN